MATKDIPLVNNAARHPAVIVRMLKQHPHTLRDETEQCVRETTKALVRAGHRADLVDICRGAGLDEARRAIINSVCDNYRH